MSYIGNIEVPEVVSSGTFPIAPEFGYGYAQSPDVVVHQFGSSNAKIEQRFYRGSNAKHFVVRRSRLSEAGRIALRDFWEGKYGAYGAFTYNCPNDTGVGTTAYTVRFADEPLSWEFLADTVSSIGVTLIEIPTTAPTYTVNSTSTRFPSSDLQSALLSQTQEIIPMIKVQPRTVGYPAIYVSDRNCTIGGQLYQPRLINFDGISQGIGGESDQASFTFGNADRVMRSLANDTDLTRASIEFSLYHVGTGIKLDLWKGEVISWDMDAGPDFRVQAADGIYELTLPYPCRRVSRTCWKQYNDGNGCPYATQSTGLDTTHFPTVSAGSCDRGYDTANGCLGHGMKRYFGGILAKPQTAPTTNPWYASPKFTGTPSASKSFISESIYDSVMAEIYCNNPSYVDENSVTKYGMPVQCKMATGRDEGNRYQALGVVGEGPLTFGTGGALDGMTAITSGERSIPGNDPAGSSDYFSLAIDGDQTGGSWRKVYTGGKTYDDNFAAGTAALVIKREDDNGLQLSTLNNHTMQAIITYGLRGWVWTGAGARSWVVLVNPVWIAINMMLKALGLRYANAATAEAYFDVTAAVAAAAICATSVTKLIGAGSEAQFTFQGVIDGEKPLRDWIQDVLQNCVGYYTWSFGKLKIGIRSNSSTVEAFTDGNILFKSLQLSPNRPAYNYLTAYFPDAEYKFASNSVTVYDQDHASLIGGAAAPLFLKAQINLAGTSTKSQAARIATERLREELGGINASQWKAARNLSYKTTVLALNVDPGMVCSMTNADMPGGAGEFRVTGWRLNSDYSIDIAGRTTVDEMYDLTVGPKPADVDADPVPVEVEITEAPLTATNTLLSDIASDDKLTPSEKQSVRLQWNVVAAEKAGIDAQADTFGVTTEKTTYDNYFTLLADYLNGGTTWVSGVPLWLSNAELGTTTDIVGTLFRAYWSNYYTARTLLLNKIADVARVNAATAQGTANTAVSDAATAQAVAEVAYQEASDAAAAALAAGTLADSANTLALAIDDIVDDVVNAGTNTLKAEKITEAGGAGLNMSRLIGQLIDTQIEDEAVTLSKLRIVPNNLNPDPYFLDEGIWTIPANTWQFMAAAAANLAETMGCRKILHLTSAVYTGTGAEIATPILIPFTGPGQSLRLRATVYNTSNQQGIAIVNFLDSASAQLDGIFVISEPGAGLETLSVIDTVPAETAWLQFRVYNAGGSTFSGIFAAGGIKLDIASDSYLIVDGAILTRHVLADQITAAKMYVTDLAAINATLGNVTSGVITSSTFRTTADGAGNYMELSGQTFKGLDTDDNVIWEMTPSDGFLSLIDMTDTSYRVLISAFMADASPIFTYHANPAHANDGAGQAAAKADAIAYMLANMTTDITGLFPAKTRYALVQINPSISSTYNFVGRLGPIEVTAGTWHATGSPHWDFEVLWSARSIPFTFMFPTGYAYADSRMYIVPIQYDASDNAYVRFGYTSRSGVSGEAWLLGPIA